MNIGFARDRLCLSPTPKAIGIIQPHLYSRKKVYLCLCVGLAVHIKVGVQKSSCNGNCSASKIYNYTMSIALSVPLPPLLCPPDFPSGTHNSMLALVQEANLPYWALRKRTNCVSRALLYRTLQGARPEIGQMLPPKACN